jgi:hypothetical protein
MVITNLQLPITWLKRQSYFWTIDTLKSQQAKEK